MSSYLLRRLGAAVLLVVVASFVVYLLMLANSDHIARILLGDEATPEQIASKQAELGLDRPAVTQYADWLVHAVRGDLGSSWGPPQGESVAYLLSNRIPVTLSIAVATVLFSSIIALFAGMAAAIFRGTVDRILQVVSILGLVFPSFWLALVMVKKISIDWDLLPATGYTPLTASPGEWSRSLALPVFALAIGAVAGLSQQVRSATIATLDRDYVRTLRSRGLPERTVLIKHVLRNSAPPTLTVLSLNFIALMSGAVMIEQVFALPGIGSLAVDATTTGNIPVVMGAVIVAVVIVVIVNLCVDLLNAWLNPKVRLS